MLHNQMKWFSEGLSKRFYRGSKLLFSILAIHLISLASQALELDSLIQWAGSGSNRAGFVINWKSPLVQPQGKSSVPAADLSLAWGFRWDGNLDAETALKQIAAEDPRLFLVFSPETQFGSSLLGIGWDANENQILGVKNSTRSWTAQDFEAGTLIQGFDQADSLDSLDPADVYWSGWNGPTWEIWTDIGAQGGLTHSPDRGAARFWTAGDEFGYSGRHGEWELAGLGLAGVQMQDGGWVGLSVASGSFLFLEPDSPDTEAYLFKKQAPREPAAATEPIQRSASSLVDAVGSFGQDPYNDPLSVLGFPARDFYDPFAELSGGSPIRRSSLVDAPFYKTPDESGNLMLTFGTLPNDQPERVILEMNPPIENDPAHPYGIDFQVFGNAFLASAGYVNETTSMNEVQLTGGAFEEPLLVAVSPGFQGLPGEIEDDWQTWVWKTFTDGPFADTAFPTQGYQWDSDNETWTDIPTDFSKPVNPALEDFLLNGSAHQITAAEAMEWYTGSGGGTGFDLSDVELESARYVQILSQPPLRVGGELDAVVGSRPLFLGDEVVVTPEELSNGDLLQRWRSVSDLAGGNDFVVEWSEISERLQFQFIPRSWRESDPGQIPGTAVYQLEAILASPRAENTLTAKGKLHIPLQTLLTSRDQHAQLFQQTESGWRTVDWNIDSDSGIGSTEIINLSGRFSIQTVPETTLQITLSDNGVALIRFPVEPGIQYELLSSENGSSWVSEQFWTPTESGLAEFEAEIEVDGSFFYRLGVQFVESDAEQE